VRGGGEGGGGGRRAHGRRVTRRRVCMRCRAAVAADFRVAVLRIFLEIRVCCFWRMYLVCAVFALCAACIGVIRAHSVPEGVIYVFFMRKYRWGPPRNVRGRNARLYSHRGPKSTGGARFFCLLPSHSTQRELSLPSDHPLQPLTKPPLQRPSELRTSMAHRS